MTSAGAQADAASGVQSDFGWALVTVLRAYMRAAETVLAGLPGGPRGYRVLASVRHDCPSSQLALAQLTGLDRTVVTYLLDDLVAAGLVERTADPADRRTRRVVVTAAGQTRLQAAEGELAKVEDHLLGGLDADEAVAFRALLSRAAVATAGSPAEACATFDELGKS